MDSYLHEANKKTEWRIGNAKLQRTNFNILAHFATCNSPFPNQSLSLIIDTWHYYFLRVSQKMCYLSEASRTMTKWVRYKFLTLRAQAIVYCDHDDALIHHVIGAIESTAWRPEVKCTSMDEHHHRFERFLIAIR